MKNGTNKRPYCSPANIPHGWLTDRNIYELIKQTRIDKRPLINIDIENISWKSKESPIQPASLDLTIGEIYVPFSDKDHSSGLPGPQRGYYLLEPGAIVLVKTKEEIWLPDDIAADGSPPPSLTMRGILVPTIGHVDPGWKGRLSIVAINMGKEGIELGEGMPIACLVLYKLPVPVEAPYDKRKGSEGEKRIEKFFPSLSPDFGNFHKIAEAAANRAATKAVSGFRRYLFPILAGTFLGTVLLGIFVYAIGILLDRTLMSSSRLKVLEMQLNEIKREVSAKAKGHK